jgi:hypothetical protein
VLIEYTGTIIFFIFDRMSDKIFLKKLKTIQKIFKNSQNISIKTLSNSF